MDPSTTPAIDGPAAIFGLPPLTAALIAVAIAAAILVGLVFASRRRSLGDRTDAVESAPQGAPSGDPGLGGRLWEALSRTREALRSRLDDVFRGRVVDEASLDALEEALLGADVGLPTAARLVGPLRERLRAGSLEPDVAREALREEARAILTAQDAALVPSATRPWVILVVGVNGSGKTTTIGKLASRLRQQGKRVMLAAGDTFRAAAADQLVVWAERAGADIVRQDEGADPGAVVYSALESAIARGHDVVIIDTAGRLQTRRPLMEQLAKLRRVIGKLVPDGPHETLLVLDGTMGQNGLSQARLFHDATPLTGVVVTKLDGTAKGGMVLTLAAEMQLPVKLIGIGERVEDLRDFDARAFVDALA